MQWMEEKDSRKNGEDILTISFLGGARIGRGKPTYTVTTRIGQARTSMGRTDPAAPLFTRHGELR